MRVECQCLSVETHCGVSVVPAGCLFEQVEPWGPNEPRENDYIMTNTSLPYICQLGQAYKVNSALNISFCQPISSIQHEAVYSDGVVVFQLKCSDPQSRT